MKLKLIHSIVISGLLLSSMPLYADWYTGKVVRTYFHKSGFVLFNLKNDVAPPNCSDGYWPFIYRLADNAMARDWSSTLLTGKMSDKDVFVAYTANTEGRCEIIVMGMP